MADIPNTIQKILTVTIGAAETTQALPSNTVAFTAIARSGNAAVAQLGLATGTTHTFELPKGVPVPSPGEDGNLSGVTLYFNGTNTDKVDLWIKMVPTS